VHLSSLESSKLHYCRISHRLCARGP
jgi:hypothetical protein